MRATDIIRGVLDLIDGLDNPKEPNTEPCADAEAETPVDDQTSRFKQIVAQLASRDAELKYKNTPNEIVSDVDSVTTDAGGGYNGPKHVDDIRIKDPRAYE